MADKSRGQRLFDARVEYPLSPDSKTRDYIFYVPPEGDDYTEAAKRFFDKKRYKSHLRHQVKSLEEIISVLHADASQPAVEHIREVVIVVHGNNVALQLPIFASAGAMGGMQFTTLGTIACLQSRLGDFTQFKNKRSEVIAKLTDKSWIVLRVCRFGQATSALYALYSFFGGRADVFAPIEYQFFGDMTVEPGTNLPTKFSTRLAYHDHLARQRFLKGDLHTPDRKDAIVRAALDPDSYSDPFDLIRRPVGGVAPADYKAVVDGLGRSKLSPAVKDTFESAGFALSDEARSTPQRGGWRVEDEIAHDSESKFDVTYTVGEKTFDSDGEIALRAQAQLVGATAFQKSVQIQMFLDGPTRANFDGRKFEIARKLHSFASPDADDAFDDATKAENSRFEAYLSLLKDNEPEGSVLSDGTGADLVTLFNERGFSLPTQPSPKIKLRPPGDHHADRAWTITGSGYKIHLEKHTASEWIEAQILYVYLDLNKDALFHHQYEVVAAVEDGNPDTPGVELQAYLDRLSVDELSDMILFLRDPYRPAHAFYINQAQLAIWRQHADNIEWLREQERLLAESPLYRDNLAFLNFNEEVDNNASSYPFTFNRWWRSARSKDRIRTPFQNDLFLEESLAQRFSIPAAQLCEQPDIPFTTDSPSTDKQKTKPSGPQFDKYSKTNRREQEFDKDAVEKAPIERVTCAEFKAVIAKVKTLENDPPDEVRDLLAKTNTAGGTSFLDVLEDLAKKYKMARKIAKLAAFKLPNLITSEKDFAKWAIKKVMKDSAIKALVVAVEVFEFVELSVLLPAELYANFLEDQQAAVDRWVYIGRLVAVRQYLRELNFQASRETLTDPIRIDLSTPSASDPEALERYHIEVGPTANVLFVEDLKRGYAEQESKLGDLQQALLETAEQITTDLFSQLGLDPCKAKALIDAGFVDVKQTRARALEALSQALLDELPVVK